MSKIYSTKIKYHSKFVIWLTMVVLVLSGSVVLAQDDAKGTKEQVSLVNSAPNMSVSQKSSAISTMMASINSIHAQIVQRVNEARKKEDLVEVDCLDEKVIRIRTLILVAERERLNFQEGVSQKNDNQINTSFIRIVRQYGLIRDTQTEATQCVGRTGIYDGDTEVEFESQPPMPLDPTVRPVQEQIVYRPADASYYY